jgi:hypothetical protein
MPVKLRLILTLVPGFAIMFPTLARLGPTLVGAKPTLQFRRAALFLRRGMSFAFLLAQGIELGLQGIITRPGRIVGVSHIGFLLSGCPIYQIAPGAHRPEWVAGSTARRL